MSLRANKQTALDAGIAPGLHSGHHWPDVSEAERYLRSLAQELDQAFSSISSRRGPLRSCSINVVE